VLDELRRRADLFDGPQWTVSVDSTVIRAQREGRARHGPRGERAPSFDADQYKHRNAAERCVNKLKTYRAVGTRYDKREYMHQGTIDLLSIWICSIRSACSTPGVLVN
jgi:transposase